MKLAVIFPGIGYHCDKPLLYYSSKAAKQLGYEMIRISYSNMPEGVKGFPEKMRLAFEIALAQTEEQLKNVALTEYEELLFISKSIGTAVASAYEQKHGIEPRNIFYTPVEETFGFGIHKGIAFCGTADPWAESSMTAEKCREQGIELYITENADHSLETGNAAADIETLRQVISKSIGYINRKQ